VAKAAKALRTKTELKNAVIHLSYEMKQMMAAAALLVRDGDGKDTSAAFLESALLHARNLIEFLTQKPKADLVTSQHFLRNWTSSSNYEAENKELNNWLAHLTWLRVNDSVPGRTWQVAPLAKKVGDDMIKFVESLPPDLQAEFNKAKTVQFVKARRREIDQGLAAGRSPVATTTATTSTIVVFKT
jgi:hypothetical protein